ncbi:MAG: DMT family transporter [Rhodobiaceae bacterium]|nr:DMT family transporter [Rhodobiaceae bacterium]MCC0014209.1 DMT family transporter [Rhodobiaceae bacterium]MCC0051435.1 DMT family transporter [Rhodobiaceae bacterium]MCC0062401.1 DMT family transporter [Rhodobiaceae bacterium]
MKADTRFGVELALLALLALLWGSSYLFIKVALRDIPPFTLIAIRVTIAAIFLLVVMRWHGLSLPHGGADWRRLFIQSFFNSVGAWTVLAWGQQYISSGLASVLNSTSPLFVFLITFAVTRHEPVNGRKLVGALVGMTGVVLVIGPQVLSGIGLQAAGSVAALTGALLYAGAAIYGRNLNHLPATVTAAGTMICASLCLVPVAIVHDRPWTLVISPPSAAAAVTLAVLCTGVALLIYFRLVRTLGSMGVASQSYLRAGIGVVLGIIVLGESFGAMVAAGLACAIIGVALINMPVRERSGFTSAGR